MQQQLFGIHVRLYHNYGNYSSVILSKRTKKGMRIWLSADMMPKRTSTHVTCQKCGRNYFIKFKAN